MPFPKSKKRKGQQKNNATYAPAEARKAKEHGDDLVAGFFANEASIVIFKMNMTAYRPRTEGPAPTPPLLGTRSRRIWRNRPGRASGSMEIMTIAMASLTGRRPWWRIFRRRTRRRPRCRAAAWMACTNPQHPHATLRGACKRASLFFCAGRAPFAWNYLYVATSFIISPAVPVSAISSVVPIVV